MSTLRQLWDMAAVAVAAGLEAAITSVLPGAKAEGLLAMGAVRRDRKRIRGV